MRQIAKEGLREMAEDPFVGVQTIKDYYITEYVGSGKIGDVYKAERTNPDHVLACKVIREGKLKDGWQREITKLTALERVPNIAHYHSQGDCKDRNNRPFSFVQYTYIPGMNLRDYLKDSNETVNVPFVFNLAETVFRVLFACRAEQISHGDLHEGNILISNPDRRLFGSNRPIVVADFGYGGSHNDIQPKDDYRQLSSIILNMLRRIDDAGLDPLDKVLHHKMQIFFRKKVLEVDPTQGKYVEDPEELLADFFAMRKQAEIESAAATPGDETKEPGDYLSAENLGYRADEWRALFVPEFLAAQELLSRNITVLTGARGCGKTMAFRRLTAFMDKVVGQPSGVHGAEDFVGFYLNCRDLTEAFPWIPPKLTIGMEQQITHFFHLAWLSEILKTLGICDPERIDHYDWMEGFLTGVFEDQYRPLPGKADLLSQARSFIEEEKENCRVVELGSKKGMRAWPLARINLLDEMFSLVKSHVSWIGSKPIYLFLDDYTIPIVPRQVQRFLNPIVFKRRSILFFKVSTEAANSFVREGLRKKPLELHQDFELIDLATESLHQDDDAKAILLDKIFRPRIDRHRFYRGRDLGLLEVLGKTPFSNNELAGQLRANAQSGSRTTIIYHGSAAFQGMWASDVRTMIQMFSDMFREANGSIKEGQLKIPENVQNKIYRTTGGEFLAFTESVRDPAYWEKESSSTVRGERFGTHLRDIVEAFVLVSRYELTLGELVKNQGVHNPKQAFRVEIIDKLDLPHNAIKYYEGLVRWHVFLQDWRGKSVRGMITPRLYLNRILIPHSNLTFSSHDNLHLSNKEFLSLLTQPKLFVGYWKAKRKRRQRRNATTSDKGGPNLWDEQ
jgi:serine/threonine protein kinase